jgi:hypothetical protein
MLVHVIHDIALLYLILCMNPANMAEVFRYSRQSVFTVLSLEMRKSCGRKRCLHLRGRNVDPDDGGSMFFRNIDIITCLVTRHEVWIDNWIC